jgi:hypothetical protein
MFSVATPRCQPGQPVLQRFIVLLGIENLTAYTGGCLVICTLFLEYIYELTVQFVSELTGLPPQSHCLVFMLLAPDGSA